MTLKKIRARAKSAKANLDAAILNLRSSSLEQLMLKLEDARAHMELDRDLAWKIASGVLAKVKIVREALQKEAGLQKKRRAPVQRAAQTKVLRKTTKTKSTKEKAAKPLKKKSRAAQKVKMTKKTNSVRAEKRVGRA